MSSMGGMARGIGRAPALAALSLALGLALSLAAGCLAPGYSVRVSSFLPPGQAADFPVGSTFAVQTNSKAANPLLEEQIAVKLAHLLTMAGYNQAPPQAAAYLVNFRHGHSSGTTTEYETRRSPDREMVTYDKDGNRRITRVPGEIYSVPVQVRAETAHLTVRIYQRAPQGGLGRPVWVGEAAHTGQRASLREVIDPLLVAALSRLNTDTGGEVGLRVPSESQAMKELSLVGRPHQPTNQ